MHLSQALRLRNYVAMFELLRYTSLVNKEPFKCMYKVFVTYLSDTVGQLRLVISRTA